jgi:LPXTG-site transpeptidase (sortase) family protein
MKRFLRAALSVVFVIGVIIALWPLGQVAYARWSQHTLRAAWQDAALKSERRGTLTQKPKDGRSTGATPRLAGVSKKSTTEKPRPAAEWPPTRIIIPEINLDAVVLQGWDEEDTLKRGPGHKPDTALPGQPGNCVIAAHRNVYGAWFNRLDGLLPGSEIELRTPQETFTYRVSLLYTVADNDASVLRAPAGPDALPRLTLVTCTLPRSTSRVVVVAQLVPPPAY